MVINNNYWTEGKVIPTKFPMEPKENVSQCLFAAVAKPLFPCVV